VYDESIVRCICNSLTITDESSRKITSVTNNTHPSGKKISSLFIRRNPIKFFPRNIEAFFVDLKELAVVQSNLTTISEHDLKPFGKVVIIKLYENELEYLDAFVFIHNPLVKRLELDDNNIKYVGAGCFRSQMLVKTLTFMHNYCYSKNVFGRTMDSIALIHEIYINCALPKKEEKSP
jgi:hypothetical protein